MQLTRGVEYGIEGTLYLARQGGNEASFMREISRATAIPETFPAKIFQRLASKRLVRSRRGFRGGSRLAPPAGRIYLREIVEALEGPIELHRGLDRLRARGRTGRCQVRRIVGQLQRKVADILEQTTQTDIPGVTS